MKSIRILLLASVALLPLASCYQLELQAQAGYAQLSVDGDVGYQNGSVAAQKQGIDDALGLGDGQGSPYVRAMADFGVPQLSVSALQFEEQGSGQLAFDFGTLTGTTPVESDLELFNAKAAYAFQIPVGPVSISPGIAIDYLDLDVSVRDASFGTTEQFDLQAPVPLAFLRGEAELGPVRGLLEIGYIEADIDDVDGSLLDAEAMVLFQPTSLLELFVGYRHLQLQLDGLLDGDRIDADLTLSGFMIGGGLRF